MNVGLYRLRPDAATPGYQTPGSVGFDLSSVEAIHLAPGQITLAPTGLVVATPPGWALLVFLRSSTPARYGVSQPHGVGVVDQDYRGAQDELRLQLLNYTGATVDIPALTPIAQGIFVRVEQAVWEPYEPEATSRGGFGSSDHST
jgi:dUTP pyrophosphatase